MEYIWQDRKRLLFFGLPWTFTKYGLSEDRLFLTKGFLNVTEDEVRLYRIMDVSLKRTIGQRIFGLGTVKICSSDQTLKDFELINVKKPKEVKELISEAVEKERVAKRVISREEFHHDSHDDDDDHGYEHEGHPDFDHDFEEDMHDGDRR